MDDAISGMVTRHFQAIGRDEVEAGEIYADDAVLEYVQSGERIRGKANIIASRQAYPGRPSTFQVHRSVGTDEFQVAELTLRFDGDDPHHVVAIVEFRDGKAVRERIYIAEPWDPPTYRAAWVEPLDT
jgi:ketosteroid isomerase-like protein